MSAVVIRHALAVHPGALGDVLLAIPALRALRAAGGSLTLAAQRHLAHLIVTLGEADAARDFETLRLDTLFAGDGRADLPDADRIVCWFGGRDADFTRRLRAQAPGAVVAPSTGTGLVWEHLLRTAGGSEGDRRSIAAVDAALEAAGRTALAAAGWDGTRRLVIIQPGAGSARKCWPAEGFAAALADLAARRDVTLVAHEGPADAAAVESLAARLPGVRRLRLPALSALAGVLRLASAYVGNDSGVSHLAAAVGVPAVIVFEATNLPWRPWAQEPEVVTVALPRVEATDVAAVRAAIGRRLR